MGFLVTYMDVTEDGRVETGLRDEHVVDGAGGVASARDYSNPLLAHQTAEQTVTWLLNDTLVIQKDVTAYTCGNTNPYEFNTI